MVHKKKYLGGLKVLLLLLFIMLLGTSSTCYARTSINTDEAEYLLQYFFGTDYDNLSVINFLGKTNTGNAYKNFTVSNITSDFITFFNNNNTLTINPNYTIFYNRQYSDNNNSSYNGSIYYTNFNNGKSSNYPHLYIKITPYTNNSKYVGFFAIDDNKNSVSDVPLHIIDYSVSNGNIVFNNYRVGTVPTDMSDVNFKWVSYNTNWNYTFRINNSSKVQNIPGVVSFSKTNAIYINFDGQDYDNIPYTRLLDTYYVSLEPDPTPPDTGGTGNITDNEGNITGSIDLSGITSGIKDVQNQISGDTVKIVNQLSGDTQRIIDNQNQNTSNIINFFSGDANFEDKNITSEDIESSLGFEIADDPYSNFWTTLTNNLKNALLGTNRSIDISFQGRTWIISLDEYLVLPPWLVIILTPLSTAFFTFILVRQWKHIFDKLASGNIDSILKENSEEGISNLF